MKIQLPQIPRKPGSTNHQFPMRLSYQAKRFLQGAIFFPGFTDAIMGQYFADKPDTWLDEIKGKFTATGLSEEIYDITWSCFQEYIDLFPKPIYQSTVFALITSWDWYISGLSGFILYARTHIKNPPQLDKKQAKNLKRLNFLSFSEQFKLINSSCDVVLPIDDITISSLEELNLVRNLGIHNFWEVDKLYIKNTKTTVWKIGDIHQITLSELENWHSCLQAAITITCDILSEKFFDVPDYP